MKLLVKFIIFTLLVTSGHVLMAMGDLTSKSIGKSEVTTIDAGDYWYDGNVKRNIVMDANVIASFGQDRTSGVDVTGKAGGGVRLLDVSQTGGSKTVLQGNDGNISPLYYDRSGSGQRRALPGGVVVSLDGGWSRQQVQQWLAGHNLRVVSELPIPNTFVIASPAGRASLELANRLYETGEVQIASPNWWTEKHTR